MFGGFRGWPIQWNHAKCSGADPCCHGNKIWPRRGDLVAYQLVIIIITHSTGVLTLMVVQPAKNPLQQHAVAFP